MDLIVASSNSNKVKRLKNLISIVNPEIKIRAPDKDTVKIPIENSRKQRKNLITKLNYYYRFFKNNVICEDDAFEFEGDNGPILIVNVNKFFRKTNDVYRLWQEYFQINRVKRGSLIKYFGVNFGGKLKICKVIIPLFIKAEVVVKKSEKNILNNFVGPLAIGKSFSQMSKLEKSNYMNGICLPALRKIL